MMSIPKYSNISRKRHILKEQDIKSALYDSSFPNSKSDFNKVIERLSDWRTVDYIEAEDNLLNMSTSLPLDIK